VVKTSPHGTPAVAPCLKPRLLRCAPSAVTLLDCLLRLRRGAILIALVKSLNAIVALARLASARQGKSDKAIYDAPVIIVVTI